MAVNTLAQSLGTAKPPVASLLSGDISRRGATSQKELPGMLERSYEAEEASQKAKIGAEQGQIQREAEALEGSAQQLRQETERVRGLEQPYQEFQAPQYTAADYAKGAATRALTAVILGGVAKTSAMTQLKAIKAMQDAERDGRTQDFEAARLTFDEAEKKRLDFNQRLKRDLDDFEKLLQTDTKAALVKAKLIGAETQDAMVKALIDKQRYGDAIKLARDQIATADKLAMQREQQAARLAEAAAKEAAKGEGAGLKPGVTATDRFSMRVKLKSISDRMQEMLQKPEFQNKLDNYRLDLFLQEQSPYLDQLLQSEIPEDVRSFAILAKTFRNQKYREESGLAVTSYEQLRQYGAVPQPGDSSKVLSDKLKTLDTGLINDINTDLKIYPALRNVGEALGYGKQSPESPKPLTDDERRRLIELRQRQKEKANSGQ